MIDDSFYRQFKQLYKLTCLLPLRDPLQDGLRNKRIELMRFMTPSEIDKALLEVGGELFKETSKEITANV